MLSYGIVVLGAYLLGSIPTGYLVARARGLDIRSIGSGNIGATNVFRILGKPAGIFVLLVDALKGFLGCMAWEWLAPSSFGTAETVRHAEVLRIVGSMGAIMGHNYTCWLRFKGGKGIATSAGALIGLLPVPFLIVLAIWLFLLGATRYVSLASIGAAVALPFATWLGGRTRLLIGVTIVMSALAVYKHRANIRRLLDGTENRVGKSKKEGAPV